MPPPNKKQKTQSVTSNTAPTSAVGPISFDVPGLPADVSINIFGLEFLVHSAILMLHSGFFRRVLRADEQGPSPRSHSEDRLSWVTDAKSKGWRLVKRASNWKEDFSTFEGDIIHEQECAEKLICALYTRPYIINTVEELETMTRLGKMWKMLPILSRTIDSVIWRCYDFADVMHKQPLKVLQMATYLRNHLLFRDALCHAAGSRSASKEDYVMEDAELYTIIENQNRRIAGIVEDTNLELMELLFHEESEDGKRGPLEEKVHKIIKEGGVSGKNAPRLPTYYRKLHDQGVLKCEDLLKSNLALDSGFHKAGVGECEERFLCAWINRADLPWDQRVIIWE